MYFDLGFESDASVSSRCTTSSGESDSDARLALVAPRAHWVCDPAFGIVHQERCTVCRHYMSHFVEGSRAAHDPSFQTAIKEREGRGAMRYLEGFEEGRLVQAEKDRTRVNRYREEREEARAKRHRAEDEVKRVRAELADMRDAFISMQIAYEEQITALALGPGRLEEDLQVLRLMELQRALFDESRGVPESHDGDSSLLEIVGARALKEMEDDGSDTDSGNESSEAGDSVVPGTSVEEAKALMDGVSQSPADPAVLVKIRDLFLEAHRTPRADRTGAQAFVIQEAWRIPTILGTQKAGSNVPPLTALPEIFVDASVQGLGFLWDGKWAAWKLNKGWRGDGRDMPWAEMVAVEMGLRTLIAAGVRSTHVRVRSDNRAVVTALSAHGIRAKQDALVLKQVLALCRKYGIVLIPVWVSTKFNPADALSRGKYPSWDLHVEAPVDIPSYLQTFVCNIKQRSA